MKVECIRYAELMLFTLLYNVYWIIGCYAFMCHLLGQGQMLWNNKGSGERKQVNRKKGWHCQWHRNGETHWRCYTTTTATATLQLTCLDIGFLPKSFYYIMGCHSDFFHSTAITLIYTHTIQTHNTTLIWTINMYNITD